MYKALKPPLNYFADFGLLTATISCSRWWGESGGGLDSNIFAAGALVSGGWLLSRWAPRRLWQFWQPKRLTMAYSTGQTMKLRPTRSSDPDVRSWRGTWKPEVQPDEFSFESGPKPFVLPVEVAESTLLRFLQKAYRRQRALLNRGYNSTPVYSNAVMGFKEFCRRGHSQFLDSIYYACKSILSLCGLIAAGSMSNGKSGQLWGEYTPTKYLEIAKYKWLNFLAPAPRRLPLSRFW